MDINNSQNFETKEVKKFGKKNWLLIVVLILLFSFVFSSLTYYFVTLDEEIVEKKEEKELEDEKFVEKPSLDVDSDVKIDENLVQFKHANYPEMIIEYLSSWEIDLEEKEIDHENTESLKETQITFTKDGNVLSIALEPIPYITGIGYECYVQGEIDYLRIQGALIRTYQDNVYTYGYLYDENYFFTDEWSDINPMSCGDDRSYTAMGFASSIGMTTTDFLFKESYSGNTYSTVYAHVSAILHMPGMLDEEILTQVDNMVLSLHESCIYD